MASPQYASFVPKTDLAAAVAREFRRGDGFEIGKPHQFYEFDSLDFSLSRIDFRVVALSLNERLDFLRINTMDPGYRSGMRESPRCIPIVGNKPSFDKVNGKLVEDYHRAFCGNDVRLDRRRVLRMAQYAWEMTKTVEAICRPKVFRVAMTMMEFAMVLEWASVRAAKGNLPKRWVPKAVVLHEVKPDIDRFMATEKIYRTGNEFQFFNGAEVYGMLPLYRRVSGRFVRYGAYYRNDEFRLAPSFVVTRTKSGWSLYLMVHGFDAEYICTGKGDPAKCEQRIIEKAKAFVMNAIMDKDSVRESTLRYVLYSDNYKIVHMQVVKYSKEEALAFYLKVLSHYHQWLRKHFQDNHDPLISSWLDKDCEAYTEEQKAAKAISNVYYYFYGENNES